jgi:hypothetical protein
LPYAGDGLKRQQVFPLLGVFGGDQFTLFVQAHDRGIGVEAAEHRKKGELMMQEFDNNYLTISVRVLLCGP